MRFLKNYKIFTEAVAAPDPNASPEIKTAAPDDDLSKKNDVVNKEALKTIQDNLNYYKQKRQSMDYIFGNKKMDDNAINIQLQKKVYDNEKDSKKRNPYLVSYESIWRLKRGVDKISLAIDTDNGRKNDVQKQINDLNDRLNSIQDDVEMTNIKTQISKSQDYMNTLNQTINSNKKELAQSDKNYQKKKAYFDTSIKTELQKIQSLSKK